MHVHIKGTLEASYEHKWVPCIQPDGISGNLFVSCQRDDYNPMIRAPHHGKKGDISGFCADAARFRFTDWSELSVYSGLKGA